MIHGVMDVRLNGRSNHHHYYYNFAQTPLVRGLDTVWIEKMEGNESGINTGSTCCKIFICQTVQFIPFMMSFGLFIAGFGAMFRTETSWGLPVLILGLLWTFVAMAVRSLKDDLGYLCYKRRNSKRYET